MRVLNEEEVRWVSGGVDYGGTIYEFQTPIYSSIYIQNHANNSSTIEISVAGITTSFNTGIGFACKVMSTGAGTIVQILSKNNTIGAAAAWLTNKGCTALGGYSTPDGDGF